MNVLERCQKLTLTSVVVQIFKLTSQELQVSSLADAIVFKQATSGC